MTGKENVMAKKTTNKKDSKEANKKGNEATPRVSGMRAAGRGYE
jgi:hypothetical protein